MVARGTSLNDMMMDYFKGIVDGTLAITTNQSSSPTSGVAANSDDVSVDATAGGVTILAANSARKGAILVNTGTGNARVTLDGSAPTATHGIQLVPGASLTLAYPFCPVLVIKAIREAAVTTTISPTEITS